MDITFAFFLSSYITRVARHLQRFFYPQKTIHTIPVARLERRNKNRPNRGWSIYYKRCKEYKLYVSKICDPIFAIIEIIYCYAHTHHSMRIMLFFFMKKHRIFCSLSFK